MQAPWRTLTPQQWYFTCPCAAFICRSNPAGGDYYCSDILFRADQQYARRERTPGPVAFRVSPAVL